ncbi:VPLPA-CTERM sorting domain-containing protein [Albimonas pacifica]|uniref:VPLPA-CTERM protein sorting domain-containing protein n=1 Tax=Albimonas pacifica TaxID=1114924 RepID=A0A1I3FNH6_9RHOB|nr:VPLPA-CTERM sorting domain-containing protein [Albimonas pacifica]SFI12501.1 VPLPA-CTERM protein sorting domain-containing protein [Albimonas pacifica]
MRMALLSAASAAAVLTSVSAAAALPVEFTWITTLIDSSVPGGVVGETVTTTLVYDNGGTSLASQTFTLADFVLYRVEGANGWWAETSVVTSGGDFVTNALGEVETAATVYGGYPSGAVSTSWTGDAQGGFWNNGSNEVFCVSVPASCVRLEDVEQNQLASSWSVAFADTPPVATPVPASIPLLASGLVALAGLRRSRRRG